MKRRISFVSNSSSCSFVCNIKKTPEQVKKELIELLKVFNKMNDTEGSNTFEKCFQEPYIDKIGSYNKYLEEFYGEKQIITKGALIIESIGDNTVPFQIMEMIEYTYGAKHFHLG